jgi:hypothetical protein
MALFESMDRPAEGQHGLGWHWRHGLARPSPRPPGSTPAGPYCLRASPVLPAASWDQAGLIAAPQQMALQAGSLWVVDFGASSHMSSTDGILHSRLPSSHASTTVGNGTNIPITSQGHSTLHTPTSDFILNNVLVVLSIIRNLLSIRQFTRDNSCSIEFDTFSFSVKDLKT